MLITPLKNNKLYAKLAENISKKYAKEYKKIDYSKYVRISINFDKDTFEYLNSIKSTLGNYAKHNNLLVVFKQLENNPSNIGLEVYKREGKFWTAFYNVLDMIHNPPVKLHKKDLIIRLNTEDKDKYVATTRKIYDTVDRVFKNAPKSIMDIFQ